MKNLLTAAVAIVCAASAYAETFMIATITDFVGDKSFQVVTRADAKELEQDVKKKNVLFQKVLFEIQNEFKKDPAAHQGEKFLGAKLKPMTVKFSPPFQDEEKARERMEKMQEHEDNKDLDTGKKKKKLSDSEKMRAVKEAEREYAIKAFGEEVVKRIEEKLQAAAAAAGIK